MNTRFPTLLFLCIVLSACRPGLLLPTQAPTMESTTTLGAPLPTQTPSAPAIEPLLPSPDPSECLGEVAKRSLGEPPADLGAQTRRPLPSQQLADYLNIMGIDSLCIPHSFGAPSLNVDWNSLGTPPIAIGRMVSIGFEGLDGSASGWGRGYLIYSTYDFEVGSEYNVFATQEDLQATRMQSMPRMIRVDGIDGFIRFFPGLSMGKQPIYITYVFPFDTFYVAAVLALNQYDPAQVNDVILQMEEGRHPDLANPDLPLFNQLVSSIRFE